MTKYKDHEKITVLLSPYISLLNDDIISVRYDLFCLDKTSVIFHKRFCINEFYKHSLFILPRFVKAKGRLKRDFYIKETDGSYFAVGIKSSLERGYELMRRSEIDLLADAPPIPVSIKLPSYLESVSKSSGKHF